MPESNHPRKVTSGLYPVWLRRDMPPEVASAHWAGPHAEIVKRVPGILEYVQQHVSQSDHGFWPASPTVGTAIPEDWQMDGFPEARLHVGLGSVRTLLQTRGFSLDEQNVFERVLGYLTGPGGGRWWTEGHDPTVGQRVALFLRRRHGVRGRTFRRFVHDRIGPALNAAGVRDLRTYTFIPWTPLTHPTPGVSHDNPPHRRYHGAVVLGVEDRAAVERLLSAGAVTAIVAEQHTALTAVHAYAIDRSVPGITLAA